MIAPAGANEAAQHVLEPDSEREHGFDISRRTGAERAGDFHGGARFATLGERNGEDSRLVRERLPCGPFGSVQGGARCALSSLLPELSVCDANPRHALNERERELVSDEPMMR